MVPVTVPWGFEGDRARLAADANWLVCSDICVPESASLTIDLGDPAVAEPRLFAQTRAALPATEPLKAAWDSRGRLQVDLPAGFDDSATWSLFPYTNEVVPAADFAPVTATGGRLVFVAPPGDALPRGLVVHQSSGQGWPLSVQAGAVDDPTTPWLRMLLFALVGGALLNLMPCVFPVLSIKALGLAAGAGEARLTKGLVFGLGVLVSFWVLAGGLLSLRQFGVQVGWGFQLQSPWFVGAMAVLMFVVAANLAGWFELRGRWAGAGQALTQQQGWRGDFFTGVFAVVVSSPCTAPLMGPAMGFALATGPGMTLAIFTMLGLGLALPMLALHISPALARVLPRPGPWMVRFKQFLAFPMALTGAWLVWVLARQLGVSFAFEWALGAVAIGLALWLWRVLASPKLAGVFVLALLAWGGFQLNARLQPQLQWQPYTAASLEAAVASKAPVLVNMTADWCISCLANEQLVFSSPALAKLDVTWIKGDWTDYDRDITAYLDQFGRVGVPLYVVYLPGQLPRVLPQVLTLSSVTEALLAAP